MRIGVMHGADSSGGTFEDVIAYGEQVEAAGIDSLWMANIFGVDAITTLALIGSRTSKIGLGTAVVPTYPRHPTAIAQQALTAAAASGNRFTLGIGLSHQVVIEGMLGMSYDKPARHMREYLEVLMPLMRGESVTFEGEQFTARNFALDVPGASKVPVVVAALGPAMLKLTGELADGTNTWMVGPKTLAEYIVPSINKAADAHGRPTPRVVAGLPVVLTTDPDAARARIAEQLVIYGQLPSYRAMLDREGAAGPADIALAGDENYLRGEITRLASIGVTDLNVAITAGDADEAQRTLEFVASLAG